MTRSYRTPKGTELPLLNLRGRDYLEVKYRLVWFREEHPDWSIETQFSGITETSATARAVIRDSDGRVIATSHKFESKKNFPDFLEKAETGAIGRALALIGYGAQFCADEFDEGGETFLARDTAKSNRADESIGEESVLEGAQILPGASETSMKGDVLADEEMSLGDPGEYRVSFGRRYKGMKLKDIPRQDIEGYVEWLDENAAKKGLPLSDEARVLKGAVGRYLRSLPESGRQAATSRPGPTTGSAQPERPGGGVGKL